MNRSTRINPPSFTRTQTRSPSPPAQTGLNFADSLPELFAGTEMGEDALRVLRESLKIRARILADIATELPHVRNAVKWITRLPHL